MQKPTEFKYDIDTYTLVPFTKGVTPNMDTQSEVTKFSMLLKNI